MINPTPGRPADDTRAGPASSTAESSTTPTKGPKPTTRLHGLDALRAAALGLGIVLHSLMPFIPGLPWIASDSRTSFAAFIPMFWIHLFRMVTFMMLAGYFGAMVLRRRGAGAYLKDRLLRIGLPLVTFWPVAVLSLALLASANTAVRGLPAPAPPPPTPGVPPLLQLFTPGQLWFLLVLLECVLITLAVRWIALKTMGPTRCAAVLTRVGGWLSSPVGALLAAVPYALCLLLQGDSMSGVREPTSIIPSPTALLAYFGAFAVGWCLRARSDSLTRITRTWPVQLPVALVLTVLGLVLPAERVTLPVHATIIALAGWTWTYALLGLSMRFLQRERPWLRYLADASYWAYLLHLPLLVVIEIPLADRGWPIMVKLVITWLVAAVVLLGSYDLLVRGSWLGKWLNGHRREPVLRRRR